MKLYITMARHGRHTQYGRTLNGQPAHFMFVCLLVKANKGQTGMAHTMGSSYVHNYAHLFVCFYIFIISTLYVMLND